MDAGDCAPLDPAVHPGAADRPDPAFEDADCDGVDGTAAQAVFVTTTGNDGAPGTRGQPVATIARGIELADAAVPKKAVLAGVGSYAEHVVLRTGVGVYGGYTAGGRSAVDPTTIEATGANADRPD